jgi:Arc/MetJ family transcription regulator
LGANRISSRRRLTSTGIRINIIRRRTTLDLPTPLLEEAQRLLGFKSKTDTVVLSLTELVRHRRIDELKSLAGHVDLGIDLGRSRRRPSGLRVGVSKKKRLKVANG